ncbi:MAG: BMC domain-containing protein [Fusobacteriaceae bacterium]
MNKALGLIEFSKIPTGIFFLDQINKGNHVRTLYSATVCPGKFIALIEGELASISESIEMVQKNSESLIDTFVLGNPSPEIVNGVMGISNERGNGDTLGVVEAFSVASVVEAADLAIKASGVVLLELRLARGMCGKSYFLISGRLSEVKHSVEVACKFLGDKGMLIDSSIISNPSIETVENIF